MIEFENVGSSDFIPGEIYKAGKNGNRADDVLHPLFKYSNQIKGVGNQGGIRVAVKKQGFKYAYMVLEDTANIDDNRINNDWKNIYNPQTGVLTYFGDNSNPNKAYDESRGNQAIIRIIDDYYKNGVCTPIFYFRKTEGRSRQFIGLAIPAVYGMDKKEVVKKQLFKTDEHLDYENLVANFTILKTEAISREWLYDLKMNKLNNSKHTPKEWLEGIHNLKNINTYEEIHGLETHKITTEGKKIVTYGFKYERNPSLRKQALAMHGCICAVCQFDYEKTYGEIGAGFIEIHHTKPLYTLQHEEEVNPKEDLVPLCANCHRMIHRKRAEIISIEELKSLIK